MVKQETPEIFPDVEHLNNVVPSENNTTGTKQLRYFAWQLSLHSRYVLHVGWYVSATSHCCNIDRFTTLHALGTERRKGL